MNAKRLLELLQNEIDERVEDVKLMQSSTVRMFNSTHNEGFADGIERAIEIVKAELALEVAETSPMHDKPKWNPPTLGLNEFDARDVICQDCGSELIKEPHKDGCKAGVVDLD